MHEIRLWTKEEKAKCLQALQEAGKQHKVGRLRCGSSHRPICSIGHILAAAGIEFEDNSNADPYMAFSTLTGEGPSEIYLMNDGEHGAKEGDWISVFEYLETHSPTSD